MFVLCLLYWLKQTDIVIIQRERERDYVIMLLFVMLVCSSPMFLCLSLSVLGGLLDLAPVVQVGAHNEVCCVARHGARHLARAVQV